MVRSTFSVELNGLVDSVEQLMSLQVALHHICCRTTQSPEALVDMLEIGRLHPPLYLSIDARAAYDVTAATNIGEPHESSLKLHPIPARDRLTRGIFGQMHWVDTRDMLADGLTNVGVDRALLHNMSNNCQYTAVREALAHIKYSPLGSTTKPIGSLPAGKPE